MRYCALLSCGLKKNKRREQVAGGGGWTTQRLPGAVLSLWVTVTSPGRQTRDHVYVPAGLGGGWEVLFWSADRLTAHLHHRQFAWNSALKCSSRQKCITELRLHHLRFVREAVWSPGNATSGDNIQECRLDLQFKVYLYIFLFSLFFLIQYNYLRSHRLYDLRDLLSLVSPQALWFFLVCVAAQNPSV